MLIELQVRDFAIVDHAVVRFAAGLNVITGETGAGKSILFQALGLVLGGRGAVELVRTGARAAEVEAVMDVSRNPEAQAALERAGLPVGDGLVIVRRVVAASGPGRAWIGGRATPLAVLQDLARHTMDFSGQHEHRVLLDESSHLDQVDHFGRFGGRRAAMAAAWQALVQADQEVRRLERARLHRVERAEFLRFQIGELEALKPIPGEATGLETELRRLGSARKLAEGVADVVNGLVDGDADVAGRLRRLEQRLADLGRIDSAFQVLASRLGEARVGVEEVAADVRRLGGPTDADPAGVDRLHTRAAEYARLCRKHGVEADQLAERLAVLRAELDELGASAERLAEAALERERCGRAALEVGRQLSEARRGAAGRLEDAVRVQLGELAMAGARFAVRLGPVTEGVVVDGVVVGERGLDEGAFLLSANRGEDLKPLVRVASGGELSRVLLALKVAVHGDEPGGRGVGTFVFDEVDTGIGGVTADRVGAKLYSLAATRQLLVITHLPQIAARADAWLHVAKEALGERTRVVVRALEGAEQVRELARMVGGDALGADSVGWARQVLEARERRA